MARVNFQLFFSEFLVELECLHPWIFQLSPLWPPCVCLSLSFSLLSLRRICSDDNIFPFEKENRLLCDSNLPPVHHDCHSVSSLLLAEPWIGSRSHCVRWVLFLSYILYFCALCKQFFHIGDWRTRENREGLKKKDALRIVIAHLHLVAFESLSHVLFLWKYWLAAHVGEKQVWECEKWLKGSFAREEPLQTGKAI